MRVLILTIATNKYIQFVERLYDNIADNFLPDHHMECLLFTEHEVDASSNVRVSQIEHEDWPIPTLKRYNYFMKEKDFISTFDYCYYFDVDMGIVDKVGDEVLSDGIVATMHPYQSFLPKESRSYDRNPKSLAYVAPGEEGENYYAGGFNGGSTKEFLKMSEVIADRVTKDLENDVIALWHDESQMNRYLIDNPPALSLTPSYCFAEEQMDNKDYPYEPKIIALKKNHAELRS